MFDLDGFHKVIMHLLNTEFVPIIYVFVIIYIFI